MAGNVLALQLRTLGIFEEAAALITVAAGAAFAARAAELALGLWKQQLHSLGRRQHLLKSQQHQLLMGSQLPMLRQRECLWEIL